MSSWLICKREDTHLPGIRLKFHGFYKAMESYINSTYTKLAIILTDYKYICEYIYLTLSRIY